MKYGAICLELTTRPLEDGVAHLPHHRALTDYYSLDVTRFSSCSSKQHEIHFHHLYTGNDENCPLNEITRRNNSTKLLITPLSPRMKFYFG